MSGTLQASIIKDSASSTNNLALDASGNVTVGNNLTVSGTGNTSFSGNLGIGTTTPAASLSVIKQTTTLSGTTNSYGLYLYPTSSGLAYIDSVTSSTGTTSLGFRTYNNGTYNDAMRIDASGNIGVGTTTPASGVKFAVVGGGIQLSGGTSAQAGLRVQYASSVATISGINNDNNTYNAISFFTSGTEAMRISTSGNLLVNGTTDLNVNSKITAWNSSSTSSQGFGTGYGTTAGQFRLIYLNSTFSNSLVFDNGTNTATLTTAGAWTNASDARLKNSIVDIKYGLSDVMKMQPRSYKMNNIEGDYIGFIAQELQTVIPEVVSGNFETQLGVDYGSLTALLTKALQEAVAKITALEDRITKLEAK